MADIEEAVEAAKEANRDLAAAHTEKAEALEKAAEVEKDAAGAAEKAADEGSTYDM